MNTKTKFTPGPWTTNNGFTILSAKGKTASSDVPNKDITDDEAIANSRLIAAAPDLLAALAALEKALNQLEALPEVAAVAKLPRPESTEAFKQARAAIVKARGE